MAAREESNDALTPRDRIAGGDLPDDSTLRGVRTSERNAAAIWVRRAAVLALLAIVLLAGTSMLGVHSATVSSSGGGYTLTVTYATVARAGLDVPFRIEVTADEEFDADSPDITVAVNAEYFSIFETQGFFPEPSGSVSVGDTVELTFDPPPSGRTFVVNYDAYIQPASQIGSDGRVGLIIDGTPITAVEFHTRLLP